MYYAVKKVINSNPEALEKQHIDDYAELNSDPQYTKLIKEERKAGKASTACLFATLPAFVVATALSVTPVPTCFYALIPSVILIFSALLAYTFRYKKSEAIKKKGAIFCNHVAYASEYYDAIQGNHIIACYGKAADEDEDFFELTIVTVPKNQPKNESEDAPTEHTISFPFCGDSLSCADRDNLVLDLDHEVLYFME